MGKKKHHKKHEGAGAAEESPSKAEPEAASESPSKSPEKRAGEDAVIEFENAGKKRGVEVWRIEHMRAVPWMDLGQFYSGDSYIVLHTIDVNKKYDLFYWLGKDSTVDEKGACALKTVELDTKLGDVPVQYRETENYESGPFIALWKGFGGIRYLAGGADSAFRHVEPAAYETRLLHVKGRRAVRVSQVAKSAKSMNEGDAFVLDAGLKIFVWRGAECNRYESQKASEVARAIKTERGAKPEIFLLDAAAPDSAEFAEFWQELGGGGAADVAAAAEGGSDEMYEQVCSSKIKLYEIGKETGELAEVTGATVPFDKAALKGSGVFVLDSGAAQPGLFVWLGKEADAEVKRKAMATAGEWLGKVGRPDYTGMSRMDAGTETAMFKTFFAQFDPPKIPSTLQVQPSGAVAQQRESEVSIANMHKTSGERRKSVPAVQRDPLREAVKIWRIEKFDAVETPADSYGQFFSGDSYIVEYVYRADNGKIEEALLYFWQGEDSTADEKGSSAILCAKFDSERFGGQATQVRVVQGKEPSNFLRLFQGKMVLHQGGCDSGFRSTRADSTTSSTTADADAYPKLYHIRGFSLSECKATQVACEAQNLNSNDVLVLFPSASEPAFVWQGAGASKDELELGSHLAKTLATTPDVGSAAKVVTEKSEPDEFWGYFKTGKQEYASDPVLADPDFAPRLFQVSNASGALRVEEAFQFTQEDLIEEDVMLLDCYSAVYVWVGDGAHEQEKNEAPKIAEQYIESSPDRRLVEDTPIVIVKAGNEPLLFTCHFVGWDASKRKGFADLYEEKQKKRNSVLQAEKEADEKALADEDAKRASKALEMEQKREEEKRQKQQEAEEKKKAEEGTAFGRKSVIKGEAGADSAKLNEDGVKSKESNPQDANRSTRDSTKESDEKERSTVTGGVAPSPGSPSSLRRPSVKGRRSSVTRCCVGGGGSSDNPASDDLLHEGPTSQSSSKDTAMTTTTSTSSSSNKPTKLPGANGRWSTVETGGYIGFSSTGVVRKSQLEAEEALNKSVGSSAGGGNGKEEPTYACPRSTKYSLVELSDGKRPEDVDPTKKEHYLAADEFHSVFAMHVDEWDKLPLWKRTQKKKDKGLF